MRLLALCLKKYETLELSPRQVVTVRVTSDEIRRALFGDETSESDMRHRLNQLRLIAKRERPTWAAVEDHGDGGKQTYWTLRVPDDIGTFAAGVRTVEDYLKRLIDVIEPEALPTSANPPPSPTPIGFAASTLGPQSPGTSRLTRKVAGPKGVNWDLLDAFVAFCGKQDPPLSKQFFRVSATSGEFESECYSDAREYGALHRDEVSNVFASLAPGPYPSRPLATVDMTLQRGSSFAFEGSNVLLIEGLSGSWRKHLQAGAWAAAASGAPPPALTSPQAAREPLTTTGIVTMTAPEAASFWKRYGSRTLAHPIVATVLGGLILAGALAGIGWLVQAW